jgi:predicted dehydrogenase
MKSLGLGVIGLGWMGQLHARTAKRLHVHYPELPEVNLVRACSRSEMLRNRATLELGFPSVTTDMDEIITDPDIDIVSICVVNDRQMDIAIRAAAAGKTIWVEKPVGRSHEETALVASAVLQAGVKSAVGFNYRQAPAVRWIRDYVVSGRLGRICAVNANYSAGYAADPNAPLSWRFDEEQAGGGASADIFSHLVDLILFTTSASVSKIVGTVGTVHKTRPLSRGPGSHFESGGVTERGVVTNDDIVSALLEAITIEQGDFFLCSTHASRVAVGPQNRLEVEIQGTLGTISWQAERINEVELSMIDGTGASSYQTLLAGPDFPEMRRFQPGPGLGIGFDDLKVIELAELLRSLNSDTSTNAVDLERALAVSAVVRGLHQSSQSGEWTRISEV